MSQMAKARDLMRQLRGAIADLDLKFADHLAKQLEAELDALPKALRDSDVTAYEESNCIICLQFEKPVVFAANPYFSITARETVRELERAGVTASGTKIVFDLLCSNGGTNNRFFEGTLDNGRISGLVSFSETRIIQLRSLHAQPLQSYARDGVLDMGILSIAQQSMLQRGRPFPISVEVTEESSPRD